MDSNHLKFWMLADERDWRLADGAHYDSDRRRLRLRSERELPPAPENPDELRALAEARLALVPGAVDQFGTWAAWDAERAMVVARGALAEPIALYWPDPASEPGPPDATVSDIALGHDGVLYLAFGGAVVLYDLRDRWEPELVRREGFAPWRLAPAPDGGVWALDKTSRQIARLRGRPLPARPFTPAGPEKAEHCEPNPDPPRLELAQRANWPADEEIAAIASGADGQLALLTWGAQGVSLVRVLGDDGVFGELLTCQGTPFAYSLAWVDERRVALLAPGAPAEAPVYDLRGASGGVRPDGDFYPLRDHAGGPFLHGLELPPRYLATGGPQPLYHLSLPAYAASGRAASEQPIDSGSAATVWHRLYLEAVIPAHCGVRVLLAASDAPEPPAADDAWHEHRFGAAFPDERPGLPRGAWVPLPSELPHHPGLLGCARERDRIGLFTALVQRVNASVRALRGRYLHTRVELSGDGRTTPELAALRAYGSRFSYIERYLPELYHEQSFEPEDASPGLAARPSTPADFLERFLGNFEGVLTPLEDRIAAAHLLTDARSVPEEALDWLGSWIGVAIDPLYPPERRRALVAAAPEIFRWRGTPRGLALALDVATGGGASRGHLVVLEDFRLRRTFATILGADLADEDDPLLAGVVRSGNSFVGDTLFLGDEHRTEFLALFGTELPTVAEEAAVLAFFEQLAHRVTVLVHRDALRDELPLIRRIVALETPAHVAAQVLNASDAFIVGLAALVGVDSYMGKRTPPAPARLDRSRIGAGDRVLRLPALDPRLEGGAAPRNRLAPQARALTPVEANMGGAFTLDASRSRAEPGHRIARYIWRKLNPNEPDERT